MAFTMVLKDNGTPKPGIVCDRCDRPVGADGRVIWGRQYVDQEDTTRPFTTVSWDVLGAGTTVPHSVFVVCDEDCQHLMHTLWGEDVGLEPRWASVAEFISLLCLAHGIDPITTAVDAMSRAAKVAGAS